MTDKLQEGEWDTEEETLASRGNGQYEPYLVVSKDEADARVARLEAEVERLREDQRRLEWLVMQDENIMRSNTTLLLGGCNGAGNE
jgi:uncharacterized small protein (DUF1192 family)